VRRRDGRLSRRRDDRVSRWRAAGRERVPVVYLGENETVRVLIKLGPSLGRYMMHCHNLVHEDHDVIVRFEVGAAVAFAVPAWALRLTGWLP
jgi:FtsP/CotA-like multicopper oxidase with cupredoxin domain